MATLEQLKGKPHKRTTKMGRIIFYLRYKAISWIENILIRCIQPSPLHTFDNSQPPITVSLTSYPGRIHQVNYAIKSIMMQTMRPSRIILWLAECQFPNHTIPSSLDKLKKLGLEIIFVPDDLRSHKKYFYALQHQKPDELVITIDDDIIYHPKTIERAFIKHIAFPNAVVCNSAHTVQFDSSHHPLSYSKWGGVEDYGRYEGKILTPLTGSGCLYPYGVFKKIAFDINLIKTNAFTADDLWIAAMINIHNIELKLTDVVARTFTTVSESQKTHLGQINCTENGNDIVIENLCKMFPQFLSYKK